MKPRLLLLLPLVSLPLADAAELGRPDMSGDEFNRRLAAAYGVLSEREPKISEVEVAILEKLAPMVTENPTAATNMVREILAEGKPVTAAFNQVLGNLYLTGGQLEAAESEFRAAIRKFPDFQRAWNSLGILYMQQDRYPEAANALARSIELGASDAMTYGMLGYSLLGTREYIAAEVAYNMALLRAPGDVQWLEGKMRILAESGRHHEVIAAADELLTRDAANREYWRLQANAHLAMGELDKAARNLEIARVLGGVEADALYLLGGIYIKQGMTEQALDAYLAAVKLEPDAKASTLLSVARSLLGQNQLDLTRRLVAAIRLDPETAPPRDRIILALIRGQLAERDGDADGAIAAFETGLEVDPLHAETLFRVAKIHADAGRPEKARFYLERIQGDANYEYGAQLFLAKMHIDRGLLAESLPPLRRALRLNPNTEVENLYNRVRVAAESLR